MFGTVSNTRGSVRILSVGVHLPRVSGGVVALHGRTLLRAETVVVEVAAREAVALLGALAAARAEQVTALAGVGSEAAALPALRAAVVLGELLAVLGSFAPAARAAALVASGALPLGGGEVVHVDVLCLGTGDDLVPADGLHVAQVVVVVDAHTAAENVAQRRQFQGMGVGQSHHEGELLVSNIELEEGSASDDL